MKHFTVFLTLILVSSGLKSKHFEKKFIQTISFEEAETKILQKSGGQMDKITCSTLCLRNNPDECYAFHTNEDQCVMIQNPEELQEARADCLDTSTPMIWTAKSPQRHFTEYVMVLSGWGGGQGATEILDLGCKKFECQKTLPALKFSSLEFAIAGMICDTPFICGGEQSGLRSIAQSCSKLVNNEFVKVNGYGQVYGGGRTRAARGNVVLNGKLLSSGGLQKGPNFVTDGTSNAMEDNALTANSQTFLISLDGITKLNLPSPVHNFHCMIKINETTVLSTGGIIQKEYGAMAQTWWQNIEALETKSGPIMNHGRSAHGCATMKFNGKTILMVVGGKNSGTTSEYLDMDDMVWKFGPELPHAFEHPIVISSREQNTIFALGGVAESKTRDEIYRLKCTGQSMNGCVWDKLGVKLKYGRAGHVVLPISNSLASDLCEL